MWKWLTTPHHKTEHDRESGSARTLFPLCFLLFYQHGRVTGSDYDLAHAEEKKSFEMTRVLPHRTIHIKGLQCKNIFFFILKKKQVKKQKKVASEQSHLGETSTYISLWITSDYSSDHLLL